LVVRNFEDLGVWEKFIRPSVKIYRFSYDFPKSEQFGLTQIRSTLPSILTNITERFVGAKTKGKFQFCCIAYGPFSETRNFTYLSKVAKCVNRQLLDKLLFEIEELRMLFNRIDYK